MKGPGPRVTTAIIFVSLMLLSLVLGPRSFMVTFGTISGLCLWEYQRLVLNKEDQRNPLRILLLMSIGLYPYIMACLHFLDIVQYSIRELVMVNFLYLLLIMSSFLLELFGRSKQ
ncbi:MAG: phosphatidate cytidylyltransferase, partial [Bacteroidota bacterium]